MQGNRNRKNIIAPLPDKFGFEQCFPLPFSFFFVLEVFSIQIIFFNFIILLCVE